MTPAAPLLAPSTAPLPTDAEAWNAGAIPFNRPFMVGTELAHVQRAHANLQLSGDGAFTKLCGAWLEARIGSAKALLTPSCTAALEMAAILARIEPGDEIVMPSYTFVSTANAFALRGGVPVFVDVRPDTLNLDETLVEAAIGPRTKAICVVHYAGVACEMDAIAAIAERHGLLLVEDAAQGILASYKGRALGGIGALGCLSFHETKNVTSGEGGALLVNDRALADRAEIVREKGTNRTQFLEGRIDKYTWMDVGSSFLPSELTAAFLWGQMEAAEAITARRLAIWDAYHAAFADLEAAGRVQRPTVPEGCVHNAHMYWLVLPRAVPRRDFIRTLAARGINAVSHYVPLHSSPAGRRISRTSGSLAVTEDRAERLVRLPLWLGLEPEQHRVIAAVREALG